MKQGIMVMVRRKEEIKVGDKKWKEGGWEEEEEEEKREQGEEEDALSL